MDGITFNFSNQFMLNQSEIECLMFSGHSHSRLVKGASFPIDDNTPMLFNDAEHGLNRWQPRGR